MDYFEKLIPLLAELGVATLSKYLGGQKSQRYADMGYVIDSHTLAEIILNERGINVLNDKELRKSILTIFPPDAFKEVIKKPVNIKAIEEFAIFNWGDNKNTYNFLNFLEISADYIKTDDRILSPIETVYLDNTLHSYQNWIRKSILQFISGDTHKRVIVHMPTGSGKTRTCVEAICDFIRNKSSSNFMVVWFAHSEELCEQAIQSFISMWKKYGSEEADVVRLWGGNQFDQLVFDKPTFIVTSFQTANSLLHTKHDERFTLFSKIKRNCDLLIVDEAHRSTAHTYKESIELFSNHNTKTIGLTATPGRHHVGADPEETKELSSFYENNMINIVDDDGKDLDDPIKYLTSKGVLSSLERHKLHTNADITLTEDERRHIERLLDIPKSVLKKLGGDATRTNLIVTSALKLAIENHYQTIIFSGTKENAIDIATSLRLKGCPARAITAESSSHERRESIEKYKNGDLKVLTNFGVLTTGFDAPNTKAIIIARPTTSIVLYSQMIGRGLRGPLMGGNKVCHLVDVIDNLINMPDVSTAFSFFDKFYKEE